MFNITASGDNVAISGVTIRHGKIGGIGGGIYNQGTLALTDSTISANTAGDDGGGIWNDRTLILTDSTVSANTAINGGGIGNGGTLTLTNSTISVNTANKGAGIWNGNGAKLTLTSSTVSNNTGGQGGGIWNSGTADLTNAILAGNSAPNSPDCSGTLGLSGHNLIGSGDGCTFTPASGDLVNVNPKLGPLADNGGPTKTHALLPGSPAIDAGDDSKCPAIDQRGVARPQGARCDIGALEVEVAQLHSLVFQVTLEGRSDHSGALVKVSGDLAVITTFSGNVLFKVAPGSYDVAITKDGFLRAVKKGMLVDRDITLKVKLLAGDVNGDGVIDAKDLVLPAKNIGKTESPFPEVAGAPTVPQPIPPPQGLAHWWPGDGNANDTIGGRHGTLSGDAAYTGGKVSQAFSLDGNGDHVVLTGAGILGLTGDFTVDTWIYITSYSGGDEAILGMDITPNEFNDTLHLNLRNEKPYFGFQNNDTPGNTTLSTNTWYLITWRYTSSGGEQAMFVNGVLDNSSTGHAAFQGTGVVYIGRSHGSNYFDGKIDEVEIFNRALTQAEIIDIYDAGSLGKDKTAPTSGGTLLYDLEFGSPPHTVGLPPVTGAGAAPRKTVRSIIFGTPTVVSTFGVLANQPLEFDSFDGTGDQIQLSLNDMPSGNGYIIDFEVVVASVESSLLPFRILLDTPQIRK